MVPRFVTSYKYTNIFLCPLVLRLICALSAASLEDAEEYYRVLLHVEDHGPLRAAEEGEGR